MRLDKFLKVSRIIKRRSVANEICDAKKVSVSESGGEFRIVRASYEVKTDDIIGINFGGNINKYKILKIKETVKKEEAASLFEQIVE